MPRVMPRRSRRPRRPNLASLLCAAALTALTLALSASSAAAFVVQTPGGHRLGVALHRGVAPASVPGIAAAAAAAAASRPAAAGPQAGSLRSSGSTSGASAPSDTGQLASNGGPVLHTSSPYLIFWDPNGQITSTTRTLLSRYFTDVAADSGEADDVYGVDRQYTDSTGYAGAGQSFSATSQTIDDTQPYPAWNTSSCPASAGVSMCLTDTQVQGEISRLIGAENLPSGVGAGAPIYFVVLPPSVDECYQDSATECSSTTFCAYHSAFGSSADPTLYAVIPMLPAAQQPKSCQWDGYQQVQEPNGDVGDVVLKYLSHEDNETITDPLGNGWYDSATGAEDGDECDGYGPTASPSQGLSPDAFGPILGGSPATGSLYDQLINGHPYYLQTEWSNGDGGCSARPSGGTLSAAFVAPAGAPGSPLSFDPSASLASLGLTSATWSFGDGSAPQFMAGGASVTQHTYARAGQYSVQLTLVDGAGELTSVTRTVLVGSAPSARLAVSASAQQTGQRFSFDGSGSSDPNAGGTITKYAWSFGDGTGATGAAVNHAYTRPGTYSVTLTVTDSYGISASTSEPVVVTAPLVTVTTPASPAPAPGATGPGSSAGAGTGQPVGSVTSGGRIGSLVLRRGRLWVALSGSGTLSFQRQRIHVSRAGTVRLRIALTASQRRALARRHRLTVSLRVTFKPASGPAQRRTVRVTLHA